MEQTDKNRKKTRTNNSNKNYPQKEKKPDELLKLLTEYINMSETAEHPTSQKRCMESGTKKRMYITENDNKRTGI